jgi:hypothetical protein
MYLPHLQLNGYSESLDVSHFYDRHVLLVVQLAEQFTGFRLSTLLMRQHYARAS